ncbi:decarboxylating 6-phosphogluconate dehydrogenase [Candidatus Dependentiae bacterium]|nr:decarboxylating 6-phosphogluconate dehydrogenase [Candidatus Dependentiae bacterium]
MSIHKKKYIGLVGLGRMGLAIAHRLIQANFTVLGFDQDKQAREKLELLGGAPVDAITEIPNKCDIMWLMVPAGKVIDSVIAQIKSNVKESSIIIDGGNSHFQDTIRRSQELAKDNIFLLDCGTSGGLRGSDIGFSLMIGGDHNSYKKAEPIFKAIAAPNGYAYLGPSGAGHYVKTVHNGVEYVILQSYADGFNLLKHGQYKDLDLHKISKVWNNGSVIRSWICELLEEIFAQDQSFTDISGFIDENLTGQWTIEEANKQNISMKLLEISLEIRAQSRQTGGDYATKIVALLRNKFGGHEVKKT